MEELRGAVKAAALVSRRWKRWSRESASARARGVEFDTKNPANVRDPSWRAHVLCTAIAHSRGRIHATKMHGKDHVVPDRDSHYKAIDSLEEQAKLLERWVKTIENYASYPSVKEGRWRPPELSTDEVAAVRVILDTTRKWMEEKEGAQAAVG